MHEENELMDVQERIEPTEEDKKKWGIRGTYVYIRGLQT